MTSDMTIRAAEHVDDSARLRAFIAAEQGQEAAQALDRHLARPRYRPAFTRIAECAGALVGYALIGHERHRLGVATIETGVIERVYVPPSQREHGAVELLIGDCLGVLLDQALPLALFRMPAALGVSLGFAPYRFSSTVSLAGDGLVPGHALRAVAESDLETLAALYESSYHDLPLTAVRVAPDWRAWLARDQTALALDDSRGRLVAYAAIGPEAAQAPMHIVEAAAADAGAGRALCAALLARAHDARPAALRLTLPPTHRVALAALHMGGTARLAAAPDASEPAGDSDMAGVVDLPGMLEALVPEFERRLALSRYAGWSGNLRVEIETERITLTLAPGRATVIDGSRPADVRLRNVTLPALAQLCLGYRAAADLCATGGLACDDSALGLIDALFPALLPCDDTMAR